MNYKSGFNRIFILLGFAGFIGMFFCNEQNDFLFFVLDIIFGLCIYLSYFIILWVIAGFKSTNIFVSNKKVLISLSILLILAFTICIEREIKVVQLQNKLSKVEREYSQYRSRIEGNYSGWTLEEIQKLFNGDNNI